MKYLQKYISCIHYYIGFNYSAPYWMGEFGVGNIDTDDDYGNWLKMIRFLEVSKDSNPS